jgi:antitoxin YefM
MKTATVSQFRAKMKKHLDDVEKDQDVLVLSGPKKKDFVLITLEAYNAMEETAHLLSNPANTARLMESIAQDKAGQIAQTVEFADSVSPVKHIGKIQGQKIVVSRTGKYSSPQGAKSTGKKKLRRVSRQTRTK